MVGAFCAFARVTSGQATADGAPQARLPTRVITTGTLFGTVVERSTQRPLADATVQVDGTSITAVTRGDGGFVLSSVPAGTRRLRATKIGYRPVLQADVVVHPNRTSETAIALDAAPAALESVRVAASAFARPAHVTTSVVNLAYEEIRRSPGALGDVSRLVQSLPGVSNVNDQRNDIVARGGSPFENLTIIDNVEVPNLNHFAAQGTTGGPISMLNNEFVQDATFLAGGFPARYGERLSSVLDVRLREGNRRSFTREADISFAGAGLVMEGPIGRGREDARGSWMASARRSYLELLAGPFGIDAVPQTANWQAKATYDISSRHKVWLVHIGGWDDIVFDYDTSSTEDPSWDRTRAGGWRTVTGVNWRHLIGGRGYGTVGVSDAYSSYLVDNHDLESNKALTFHNRSRERETTVKYDASVQAGTIGALTGGVSVKWFRNRERIAAPLGASSPHTSQPGRVDPADVDEALNTSTTAGYLQLVRTIRAVADVTVGVRAQHFDAVGASRFEPRAGLVLHATPTIDLTASYGRYHQLPAFAYLALEGTPPALRPMRADHYVAGLTWTPIPDLRTTVEGYRKNYADYPVAVAYPHLSLANTGDQYGIDELLFAKTSAGTGRTSGIDLFVQKKLTDDVYGQAAYSYTRVRHAALDGVLRRGAFDIPHTATVIAGYVPSRAWEFSTRVSYATGRPFTPADLARSEAQNRLVYDLSRMNAERSPAYVRLDFRADRRFTRGGMNVVLFLELQNVTNHTNVFQYEWNEKVRRYRSVEQISFLPVLGATVQF